MSNIEERVKKIIIEQLGVKEEEIEQESKVLSFAGVETDISGGTDAHRL